MEEQVEAVEEDKESEESSSDDPYSLTSSFLLESSVSEREEPEPVIVKAQTSVAKPTPKPQMSVTFDMAEITPIEAPKPK